jgi:hypothetical protein
MRVGEIRVKRIFVNHVDLQIQVKTKISIVEDMKMFSQFCNIITGP